VAAPGQLTTGAVGRIADTEHDAIRAGDFGPAMTQTRNCPWLSASCRSAAAGTLVGFRDIEPIGGR